MLTAKFFNLQRYSISEDDCWFTAKILVLIEIIRKAHNLESLSSNGNKDFLLIKTTVSEVAIIYKSMGLDFFTLVDKVPNNKPYYYERCKR